MRKSKMLGLMVLGAGLAPAAMGEEGKATGVNVITSADSMKVGGEFRSELKYDNNGFQKGVPGAKATATTRFNVDVARIKMSGNINPQTEYKFRFSLLGPASAAAAATYQPLDYGYGTYWFNKTLGFSIGKQKVMQGGWDQLDNNFKDHVQGAYAQNFFFQSYEPMLAVHANVAGKLTLQVLNDLVDDTTTAGTRWNKTQHPTYVVGWAGDLGTVSPLVDVGTADNQKSGWVDVGVKATVAGLDTRADVRYQRTGRKGVDASGKAKAINDNAMSYTLKVAYNVPNVATPWVYYSSWDKKQGEDKVAGTKDIKTDKFDPATGAITFDDNGQFWGVGADLNSFGKNWWPYVAVVGRQGKIVNQTTSSGEKTVSDIMVRVGALGEI